MVLALGVVRFSHSEGATHRVATRPLVRAGPPEAEKDPVVPSVCATAPSKLLGYANKEVTKDLLAAFRPPEVSATVRSFMSRAVELSRLGAQAKSGAPIGALIVAKDGTVLGTGHSQVAGTKDPTAHAEVVAIRNAAKQLGSPDLQGATLYTSVAPCPMCLAAAYWANIGEIYYAISTSDASERGFPDGAMFEDFAKPEEERTMKVVKVDELNGEALKTVSEWFADEKHARSFRRLHAQESIARLDALK